MFDLYPSVFYSGTSFSMTMVHELMKEVTQTHQARVDILYFKKAKNDDFVVHFKWIVPFREE